MKFTRFVPQSIVGVALVVVLCGASQSTCSGPPTSNDLERDAQEKLVSEGNAQVGMPAIINFRERKMMKTILELRDQANFVTYTYLWSDMKGQWIPFCQSVGYPIPYSTQYTAHESEQRYNVRDRGGNWAYGTAKLPQADPNGLFMPSSAEGTWVLCKDPNGQDVKPVYVEPRAITSPFKMSDTPFK